MATTLKKQQRGAVERTVLSELTRNGTVYWGCESKLLKDCLNLTKESLRIIVRILAGHWRLDYHLGKAGKGISKSTVCIVMIVMKPRQLFGTWENA